MDRNPGDLSNKETNEIDFLGGDDLDGEEEFEFTDCGGQNKEDDEFDELVGALQDIVMDPEFEDQQREFLERNCMIFEDEEENKMEYMSIFKEYQAKIEGEIERRLQELKPELNMKKVFSLIEEESMRLILNYWICSSLSLISNLLRNICWLIRNCNFLLRKSPRNSKNSNKIKVTNSTL